jgi:hypothetical protein
MAQNKPHRGTVSRENHIRRDTDTSQDVSLGLMELDETIKYYFENVAQLQVVDSNNRQQKVPVIYGSPERWKSVQKSNFYRDTKGKIQLPIVMFRRTSIAKNRELGMKVDVNNPLYHFIENKYSKESRYDKFDVLQGRRKAREFQRVVVPDHITATYECIVWTEYITQMNKIVEAVSYAEGSYWGDQNKYLVKAKIDDFSSATELASGEDRAVKSEFTITINGHIIPNTVQKQIQQGSTKTFSPAQVIFSEGIVGDTTPTATSGNEWDDGSVDQPLTLTENTTFHMDTVAAAEIIVPQGIELHIVGILTVNVTIQNYGFISMTEAFIEDGGTIENKTNPDGSSGQYEVG